MLAPTQLDSNDEGSKWIEVDSFNPGTPHRDATSVDDSQTPTARKGLIGLCLQKDPLGGISPSPSDQIVLPAQMNACSRKQESPCWQWMMLTLTLSCLIMELPVLFPDKGLVRP